MFSRPHGKKVQERFILITILSFHLGSELPRRTLAQAILDVEAGPWHLSKPTKNGVKFVLNAVCSAKPEPSMPKLAAWRPSTAPNTNLYDCSQLPSSPEVPQMWTAGWTLDSLFPDSRSGSGLLSAASLRFAQWPNNTPPAMCRCEETRAFPREKRTSNGTGWKGVGESELENSVTRVQRHWLLKVSIQDQANRPCSLSPTASHSAAKGDRRNCQP